MAKLSEKSKALLAKAMQKKTEEEVSKRLKASAKRKSAGSVQAGKDKDEKISFAKYLRGAIQGNWNDAEFEKSEFVKINKALAEGIGYTGGFLVPVEQNRELIEMIRAKLVVRGMPGVRTYNMSSNSVTMPRLDTGTTASWGGENVAIASSAVTFGQIQLVLRKCVDSVVIPNELIEDADPTIEDIVNRDLTEAVAKAVDIAFLEGTGGTQPTGLYRQPHINSTDLSGAADYDNIWDAIYRVRLQDHEINAWVSHPRLENSLRKLKDGEGRYIYDGVTGVGNVTATTPKLLGIPIYYTTNIPITNRPSSDESYLIGGDWSQLIIGEKGTLRLEASRDVNFTNDQTVVKAVYRTDMALRHPEAFVLVKGITA